MIPGDEVIFIFEMAVKGRRGITAVLGDIPNGDLIHLFLFSQFPKGLGEDIFRCFALHIIHPF